MPKHKQTELKQWATAATDCREQWGFAMIGKSLVKSAPYMALKPTAQTLYVFMIIESQGHREFEFTRKTALSYGLRERSFRYAVDELIAAKFIERKSSGKLTREANIYSFSFGWKTAL